MQPVEIIAAMLQQSVLLLLLLVVRPLSVSGHAYIYWPASRNFILAENIAHCFNVPGPEVNFQTAHNDGGKAGPSDFAKGLCGNFAQYLPTENIADDGIANGGGEPVATYQEGTSITFKIVNNAEHGGHYEFRVCDQKIGASIGSREDAARCLDANFLGRYCVPRCGCDGDTCRETPENNDPNNSSFYSERGPPPHLQQGGHQLVVDLPMGLTCEHCTIQWFWHTAWGEQFWNCIDVKIQGSGGGGPSPPQVSTMLPTAAPVTTTPSGGVSDLPCVWTSPLGRQVTMTKQNEKPGRICWEVVVPSGTSVHYQAQVDIYHAWNVQSCCLAERSNFGTNVVTFTPSYQNFGFCECIGWTPETGGTTCAGQATAENMICPVSSGGGSGRCIDKSPLSQRPAECGAGGTLAPSTAPPPIPTLPPSAPCADDWTNCLTSRCCASAGFTCYEQDASYAECRSDACPASWSCNVLGGQLPTGCTRFCSMTAVSSCKSHQNEHDCEGNYFRIGARTMPCTWSGCGCNAEGASMSTCPGLQEGCASDCLQLCGKTELSALGLTCGNYSHDADLCTQKYFNTDGVSISCKWLECSCVADGEFLLQCPLLSEDCAAM